jgi:NAD(P)H-hydrate repair Nnr-like enzyme with NAD(P)H-hydrate dehydratase domain
LSGVLGTFSFWTNNFVNKEACNEVSDIINPNLLAAYCASTLVRTCNRESFHKNHRSMLTTDMIHEIPNVFYNLFDFLEKE